MILMSRYSKLKHGLIENINWQVKFGQSKNDAKRKAIKETHEKGERFTAIQEIYGYSTRDCYIDEADRFACWVTAYFNCKTANSAKQYVRNYIKRDIERGLSPWTVHTRAFALAGALQCPVNDFGVDLPKREREGGGLEIHLLEKGGKHRWAWVNQNSEAIVREYFDIARERDEDALVFPKGALSNRVDIHACRVEYARYILRFMNRKIVQTEIYTKHEETAFFKSFYS